MSKEKKEKLIQEAGMQSMALRRIALWRGASVLFSALGILAAWFAFQSEPKRIILGVISIILALFFMFASAVCHIGIRNGTANVKKILEAAEKE